MMKNIVTTVVCACLFFMACQESKQYSNDKMYASYDEYPVYEGNDLGINYSPKKTIAKLWSPAAQEVKINIYDTDQGGEIKEFSACYLTQEGVWVAELKGDYKNNYYAFQAKFDGVWSDEVPDPYAKAVGTNGNRGMIIDLNDTHPADWSADQSPELVSPTDIVLYELHIRDFSNSPNSGMENKGKYAAFSEKGTLNSVGMSTGIDHLVDLGITHLHLLPSFDYQSVDESRLDTPQFNWGYDPQNYNTPEGSYSSNPADGKIRIKEYKQMVKALHDRGIRVVMDVVYNHTALTKESCFEQLVPGYYYRQWEDGSYSNGSGCGNEIASDRPMVRKFMIESVKYWVNEFHVDGFRFDLMGLHDQETMNKIGEELRAINPTIFIYGEGWTAGDSPLPEEQRALKKYAYKMNDIAVFDDNIRDGIKGHYANLTSKGFANGNFNLAPDVKFGIAAAGAHPQLDTVAFTPYTVKPQQVINYVSCHDNNTLYDKLKITLPKANNEELTRLNALCNAIVLTSQGVPFLHAGVEMNRTKFGVENSYNSSDSINQINWDLKAENLVLYNFYKNLIALRKNHSAFRMNDQAMIQKNLHFLDSSNPNIIYYNLTDNANGDTWKNIIVAFNADKKAVSLTLPEGDWNLVLQGFEVNELGLSTIKGHYLIPAQSAAILYQ